LLEGFAVGDEEDAAGELTEVTSFEQRYTEVLDKLTCRTEVREGKRVVATCYSGGSEL
jgi:hypothetical protein